MDREMDKSLIYATNGCSILLMDRRQASSKCGINQISVHDLFMSYVIWVTHNLPETKHLCLPLMVILCP